MAGHGPGRHLLRPHARNGADSGTAATWEGKRRLRRALQELGRWAREALEHSAGGSKDKVSILSSHSLHASSNPRELVRFGITQHHMQNKVQHADYGVETAGPALQPQRQARLPVMPRTERGLLPATNDNPGRENRGRQISDNDAPSTANPQSVAGSPQQPAASRPDSAGLPTANRRPNKEPFQFSSLP